MASTKSGVTVQASASNAAAGTTTSGTQVLTTSYGMFLTAKITNGATAPTLPCSFIVEVSHDAAAWKEIARFTSDLVINSVLEFSFAIDPTILNARVVFTGNTDEAVTVESFGHILTGV